MDDKELLERAAIFRRRVATSQDQLQDVSEDPGQNGWTGDADAIR